MRLAFLPLLSALRPEQGQSFRFQVVAVSPVTVKWAAWLHNLWDPVTKENTGTQPPDSRASARHLHANEMMGGGDVMGMLRLPAAAPTSREEKGAGGGVDGQWPTISSISRAYVIKPP